MLVNDITTNSYDAFSLTLYVISLAIFIYLLFVEILKIYYKKRLESVNRQIAILESKHSFDEVLKAFSEHMLKTHEPDSKVPWDIPIMFDYDGKIYEIILFKNKNKEPFVKIRYIKESENGINAEDS